jgi:hypothetical protein
LNPALKSPFTTTLPECWQSFCTLFEELIPMYLLLHFTTADLINELAFFMALLIVIVFYTEYKKCVHKIEKEEMLNSFLKD